jgi:hypothetical protein
MIQVCFDEILIGWSQNLEAHRYIGVIRLFPCVQELVSMGVDHEKRTLLASPFRGKVYFAFSGDLHCLSAIISTRTICFFGDFLI